MVQSCDIGNMQYKMVFDCIDICHASTRFLTSEMRSEVIMPFFDSAAIVKNLARAI